MHSKSLTLLYPDADILLENPINALDKAISAYGEIKTYFSKYKNPVGIELEIEGVSSAFMAHVKTNSFYWHVHEDNSLKFQGKEFISVPLSGQNIDYAIHEFARLSSSYSCSYTVRTSTHVHLNVSLMNWEEFCYLVLLSAYVEPLLYTLCEPSRRGNPYCYPISNLEVTEAFRLLPDMKYCGINLAPVRRQMTLEFRQLHGTNDWKLLRRWIQLISKLYYFAKNTSPKEIDRALKEVVSTRNHEYLIKRLFGASIVLFNDLSLCDENLMWVTAARDYLEQ